MQTISHIDCIIEITPNLTALYHAPAGEYTSKEIGLLFQRCSQHLRQLFGNELAKGYRINLVLNSPIFSTLYLN